MRKSVFGVIALGLLTAACGTTEQQRAATGGLTGLGVGALVGGPIGAVIGGAAGATGGAIMPESATTLALNAAHQGKKAANSVLASAGLASPQQSAAAAGSSTPPAVAQAANGRSAQVVKEAQRELQREGLYKGHIDGIAGPKTRRALTAFQAREGLQQTADLDQTTLQRLNVASSQTAQAGGNAGATQGSGSSTPPAGMNSADVRKRLEAAGYSHVSNVTRQSDTTFTARADRGTSAYRLQIDARSGRIVSQQKVAANEQGKSGGTGSNSGMSGSTTNGATNGSGSDMTNGSGNATTPSANEGSSSNEAGSPSSGTGASTTNGDSGTNR